jgi:hypothetical protein
MFGLCNFVPSRVWDLGWVRCRTDPILAAETFEEVGMSGLRKSCVHGRFEEHWLRPCPHPYGEHDSLGFRLCQETNEKLCPGGGEVTIDDCIAWLRAQGADGVIRIEYRGPKGEPIYVDVPPSDKT